MSLATLLAFALVAFIGIATPGPTVLLALRNGSRYGLGPSIAGMLGAAASDVLLICAAAIGLGAILATSQTLFEIVKWIGVIYLAYLGIMLLRSKPAAPLDAEAGMDLAQSRPRNLFAQCFLVAVTNPKGYLFFSAFLPHFVDPYASQALQYATLGLIFVLIDLAVMAGYAAIGWRLGTLLTARRAVVMDRVCGGTLLTLACLLATYRKAG